MRSFGLRALNKSVIASPKGARRSWRLLRLPTGRQARNDGLLRDTLNKIAGGFCLILFLFQAQANAQENVSGGWPVPQTEHRETASGSVGRVSSGPASVSLDPRALGAKVPETVEGVAVTPPFPVSTPVAIVYPKKAVRRGWEGQTVVAAEVLPDGSVGRTSLAQSSGHEILDSAAQDSIKAWKFEPAPGEDDKVPQFVDIPVTFKLED